MKVLFKKNKQINKILCIKKDFSLSCQSKSLKNCDSFKYKYIFNIKYINNI